ncbi:helix-turn-helix domain-containing protein [Prolixibacteraceae bacterium Z1-6]|uniref:Helix-turn-helix domain-containing protein n=1 Tax=Draconibacterium aestuarii TaxID=2998507 RepID=A0A9X3F4K5_9BACT|nr:helix-turn-helix domain-containing protein [Prolixibacteraceae bacterium Z1-6]
MEKIIHITDAEKFKKELSDEIYERLKGTIPRKWLRSSEVCEMLGISYSVLQQARIAGDIPAAKLSTGTWLYPYDGVVEALEAKTTGGRTGKL